MSLTPDHPFSEYHRRMRPLVSAPVASFTLLAVCVFLAPSAHSQLNGVPSSVTSAGFGGRAINGASPSVTALGPQGYAPNPGIPLAKPRNRSPQADGEHHRHDSVGPVWYAVPVPYAADDRASDDDPDYDPNDQGGPTVFDRRGSGARSYVPPLEDPPPAHPGGDEAALADEEPAQAPTTLIFEDGHKLEVGNYAIVGATLFDLTPGHSRRVELADLDLEATEKENEDHGVVFQLPVPPPH
jgi:hypothetical protein